MYWYRLRAALPLIGAIMLAVFFSACKPDARDNGHLKYFDLKDYFIKDSARLTKENKIVFKTVTHNGVSESKKVHIANWGGELNLFKDADINKPAWKDSYKIIDEDSILVYRAKKPNSMKVREILINKTKEKIKWILIYNKTPENTWLGLKIPSLYQTSERLIYFPDSLYIIERVQRVKLIGTNVYKIRGEIIK